jgi:hypothetical protein
LHRSKYSNKCDIDVTFNILLVSVGLYEYHTLTRLIKSHTKAEHCRISREPSLTESQVQKNRSLGAFCQIIGGPQFTQEVGISQCNFDRSIGDASSSKPYGIMLPVVALLAFTSSKSSLSMQASLCSLVLPVSSNNIGPTTANGADCIHSRLITHRMFADEVATNKARLA